MQLVVRNSRARIFLAVVKLCALVCVDGDTKKQICKTKKVVRRSAYEREGMQQHLPEHYFGAVSCPSTRVPRPRIRRPHPTPPTTVDFPAAGLAPPHRPPLNRPLVCEQSPLAVHLALLRFGVQQLCSKI